jgi:hypothetical protein
VLHNRESERGEEEAREGRMQGRRDRNPELGGMARERADE